MNLEAVELKIQNFERGRRRLAEAVEQAEDALDRDGVIQRFEFTVELFWKALKAILAWQGIECRSPRSCFRAAFQAGLIDEDETVLDMLEDRNNSSHIYDEAVAQAIFERIRDRYLPYLQRLSLKAN